MAKKKSVQAGNVTKKKTPAKKITQGLATLALILNVIFPGIGSLLGGKIKTGIFQLVLMIVVLFLFPLFLGIVAWVAALVWGIVTGVLLIREAI